MGVEADSLELQQQYAVVNDVIGQALVHDEGDRVSALLHVVGPCVDQCHKGGSSVVVGNATMLLVFEELSEEGSVNYLGNGWDEVDPSIGAGQGLVLALLQDGDNLGVLEGGGVLGGHYGGIHKVVDHWG